MRISGNARYAQSKKEGCPLLADFVEKGPSGDWHEGAVLIHSGWQVPAT